METTGIVSMNKYNLYCSGGIVLPLGVIPEEEAKRLARNKAKNDSNVVLRMINKDDGSVVIPFRDEGVKVSDGVINGIIKGIQEKRNKFRMEEWKKELLPDK